MRNMMSYDASTCRDSFTPYQLARMRCYADQDLKPQVPTLPPGICPLSITAQGGTARLEWVPPVGRDRNFSESPDLELI